MSVDAVLSSGSSWYFIRPRTERQWRRLRPIRTGHEQLSNEVKESQQAASAATLEIGSVTRRGPAAGGAWTAAAFSATREIAQAAAIPR